VIERHPGKNGISNEEAGATGAGRKPIPGLRFKFERRFEKFEK